MSKFGSVKVDYDGHSFASKLEAATYQVLKFRQKAGELKILQVQDHMEICGPPGHICTSKCRIIYIPDFKCEDGNTGEIFWVEAKGVAVQPWQTKLRLYRHYGLGKLEIWGGSHLSPSLMGTIFPAEG